MSKIYYSFCLNLLTFNFELALIIGCLLKLKGNRFLIRHVRKLDKEISLPGGSIGFRSVCSSSLCENYNNDQHLIWKP